MKKKKPTAKKPKRKMTLERLAELTQAGFLAIERRFDDRFDEVDGQFAKIEARLDRIEQRLENLEGRMTALEQKVAAIRSEIASMHYDSDKVKARIENIELKVFGSIQE